MSGKQLKRLMLPVAALFLSIFSGISRSPAQDNGQVRGKTIQREKFHVVITPRDTVLKIGETAGFTAVLMDSAGNPLPAEFNWRVVDPLVGQINASGQFTALASGHTAVIAQTQETAGKASVNVWRDAAPPRPKPPRYFVAVTPRDTCVRTGVAVQFKAVLLDSEGKPVEAAFTWRLEEETFGSIDANGLFTAAAKGQGFVFATTSEFTGKAHVTVAPDSGGWKPKRPAKKLAVLPKDTLVAVGAEFIYKAVFIDTDGVQTPASVIWDMAGRPIGSISSDGTFKALYEGVNTVRARTADKYTALARIRIGQIKPGVKPDSVRFHFRDKNNNRIGFIHRLTDKDVLKISGLPFPLNFLNGGELVFAPGSLGTDVDIDITLPDVARVKGDTTVDFINSVLTGVRFHVYVNGRLVSPFVFKEPVQIVLPYKPELMDKLGLTTENIWAFFCTSTGQLDGTGISSVVVDTTECKIYIEVSHFSDIVIANRNAASVTTVSPKMDAPRAFQLYENYPNPFNPETQIRFDVSGTGMQKIRLSVYDILGREIRVLADRTFAPGSHDIRWDGRDASGIAQGSGLYILRMESAQGTLTRRMVLMK